VATTEPAASKPGTQGGAQGQTLRLWLASLGSADEAKLAWQRLQSSYGDLFQGMDLKLGEIARDQRTFYRILVGPVADRTAGKAICQAFQEREPDAWCKVVSAP
jgi:SPOR domain